MISFWVYAEGALGIRGYMENRGKAIKDHFTVHCYEGFDQTLVVPGGPQIFAALDMLGPAARSVVAELHDQLARLQPGVPLLNDPRRSLLRPALLTLLADRGINRFRAYGPRDADQVTRFPVFIREPYEHQGTLTPLLHSPATLRKALASLRIRGHSPADLLIVEFCDTSDRGGIFRKYSAYRVGEAIIPAHMMAGRHWVMKSEDNERTVETAREDRAYVEENPHAAWLQQVFDLAGIGYGRIDYGVSAEGSVPQAWEINLNPSLGRGAQNPRRQVAPEVAEIWNQTRELAHSRIRAAFVALEREAAPPTLPLRLKPELLARVARESAARRRRGATLAFLQRLYGTRAGAPFRRVVARFFPHPDGR